ncbi:MAG: PIN domain-containing protein, partial [Gammaproteobacteria bacterium]
MTDNPAPQRSFLVIPDTNVIWADDSRRPDTLFNLSFTNAWRDLHGRFGSELVIPAIVRDERVFRLAEHARKMLSSSRDGLKYLRDLTGEPLEVDLPSDEYLRAAAQVKFDEQLAALPNARIEPTPIDTITWGDIVKAAVWRRPPFDPSREKGFRDAIVLETVKQIVASNRHSDIAFLVQDNLLRKTADDFGKKHRHFATYKSIEDFNKFASAVSERFPPDVLHKLTERAGTFFFDGDSHSTLWDKEELFDRLLEKFQHRIAEPPANVFVGGLFGLGSRWLDKEAVHEFNDASLEFTVGRTELMGVIADNEFHWRTNVLLITEHYRKPAGLLSNPDERISFTRFTEVSVEWATNVTDTLDFHEPRILSLDFL